eukprot:CAMPEP_0118681272 /NCGR_PEP_ID=MMETSP0800-20121206/4846_1 /TAXON_ID=210618 ORGANISM="Striatella unipunctata, Strain CCMP2910" /NCGR_SAMPLE_ID=MMETSP0800 /ASSEMBLY_ACC=CAM_ASM_000638 /LENGTH=48 /DNA_ID= /DNA_START= /DNA_END= /DNA_ORIENTATION=
MIHLPKVCCFHNHQLEATLCHSWVFMVLETVSMWIVGLSGNKNQLADI